MNHTYYESRALVDLLCNASDSERNIIFLAGSALSVPDYVGGHGVPGVSGMMDLIRREFEGTQAETEYVQNVTGCSADGYRRAFEFLHGHRGQDAANQVVRKAVWQALDTKNWPPGLAEVLPQDADDAICKTLEKAVDAWILPRAVDALGNLLATYRDTFGGAVLTTNFDPLIEVSMLKHGGRFYRTVLHDDGKLSQTVAEGTHIVHLHGYWYGYDTLHTPHQLIQPRPQLGRSLGRVVEASTLVVLGYGGWDDVITRTLMGLLADSESNPQIVWAFHDHDPVTIERKNERLFDALAPGIARGRVLLYQGVDCSSLLTGIHEKLRPSYAAGTGIATGSRISTVVERNFGDGGARKVRIEFDFPLPEQSSAEPDRPLFVDHWIGREQELNILASLSTPVGFVTGLGGQGKSALAGRFLQDHATGESGRFEIWDWRDCREQSERLNTQILRVIERLSGGAIDASRIESTDLKALLAVLFRVLGNKKALLVFDNVDQYVDLETLEPVKGLDTIVSEAQARRHDSFFLFTCRPDVRVDESRSARLSLSGLSESETERLILACGVRREDGVLAEELHKTTKGHPLWIRLVAMQAIGLLGGLREALDLVNKGGATLPDTTRTIWNTLTDQQRNVLRTMAELDRPEPESRLLDLLPGANVNRVTRALRSLRSFHLIEARMQPEGEPLLGLHPIIREFVRMSFPKRDREKYVGAILGFLDRRIGQFKSLLPLEPSYEIMEHWARKAEFQITFGHFDEATSTIAEIVAPLVQRGYSEQMIRLARRLFGECDWAEACSSYKDFDEVFQECLLRMIELGHEAVGNLLKRFEDAIPGKSSQFILLCDLRCYAEWHSGNYDTAIRWGEEGKRLKTSTSVDTQYTTTYHLALAHRDAGRVAEAISGFLDGESLETLITPGERIQGKDADFYGNIGRCLFLSDRTNEAIVCYVKSAQLLEEGRTYLDRLNRGYIRYWIAELMVRKEEFELGASMYRAAILMWEECSPPRATQASRRLGDLVRDDPDLCVFSDKAQQEVEFIFGRWLDIQKLSPVLQESMAKLLVKTSFGI